MFLCVYICVCVCVCVSERKREREIDLADEKGPQRSAEGLFCEGLGTMLL